MVLLFATFRTACHPIIEYINIFFIIFFYLQEWMKHIKSQLVKANGQKSDNYYYTYK